MGEACKKTLCTSCAHLSVCLLKETYLKAQESIDQAWIYEVEGDSTRIMYIANLRDWLTIPALKCKHYQKKDWSWRNDER